MTATTLKKRRPTPKRKDAREARRLARSCPTCQLSFRSCMGHPEDEKQEAQNAEAV
jgi:hypothetical protein